MFNGFMQLLKTQEHCVIASSGLLGLEGEGEGAGEGKGEERAGEGKGGWRGEERGQEGAVGKKCWMKQNKRWLAGVRGEGEG